MAKKEAESEGEGDNPAAEGADAAPKKLLGKILGLLKKKKVLMIGARVLVLLRGGAGAGVFFFVLKAPPEKKPVQEVQLPPPLVKYNEVDDFLVNIQSPD